MSDLRDLYQEVIFDHNKRPRNFHAMEGAHRVAEGHNPLCGDDVKLYLKLENGVVSDVSFQGHGCAISTASASLMTEAVKGKPVEEAERLFAAFHAMLTGAGGAAREEQGTLTTEAPSARLGKLEALSGVKEFPVRVKCATLAWHTLRNALAGKDEAATTE